MPWDYSDRLAPAYPVCTVSCARGLQPLPGLVPAGASSFLKHADMVSARHSVGAAVAAVRALHL